MGKLVYRDIADARGEFLPWVHELRNRSGAYIIKRRGQVVYVGESHTGNLAKTLKRHFWNWKDDPERIHHTYPRGGTQVAIRLTPPKSAVGAQNNLMLRLEPRDNGYLPAERPF